MIKRPIRYRDLDNNVVEEEFYFHYSTAEAVELKTVLGEDMHARIQKLIEAENAKEIISIFRGLISDSVGKKSITGKAFIKSDEIRDEFMNSDAYSELLIWLLSATENMSTFINGVFPENMQERVTQLAEERASQGKMIVDLPKEAVLAPNLKNLGPVPSIQSPIGSQPRPRALNISGTDFMNMTFEEFAEWKANQI